MSPTQTDRPFWMKQEAREAPIRVLLIEDNRGDARLIEELLREEESNGFELMHAERLEEGLSGVDSAPDVILLDLSLPDSQGLATFTKVHEAAPGVPVVVMSGLDDSTLALDAVRSGAQDYLVKGRVDGHMLARVMRYAIERKTAEEKLRRTAAALAQSNENLDRFSRELSRANERLKKLDELKTDFISAASHELRTPLTSIKGYMSIVLQEKVGELNERQREFLGYVKEATNRLHRLLDELLDLSRIESGRVEMHMAQTDILALLREEAMIFKVQADEKNIAIALDFPENLQKIYCDPDKIRQVADNLFTNAIKYTPAGGKIRITAKDVKNGVEIKVEDTGIGISAEDQARIFEPFQRIQKKGVEEEDGVGLGLAVVKSIVSVHGGKVSVQSQEGKGSAFTVHLPVEKRMERHHAA